MILLFPIMWSNGENQNKPRKDVKPMRFWFGIANKWYFVSDVQKNTTQFHLVLIRVRAAMKSHSKNQIPLRMILVSCRGTLRPSSARESIIYTITTLAYGIEKASLLLTNWTFMHPWCTHIKACLDTNVEAFFFS